MSGDPIARAEAALDRAEAGFKALRGTLERYGQHDPRCDALMPMWHKGPCDCGWEAAVKALAIDTEVAGKAPGIYDGKPRYVGGRRVDMGAVPELAVLLTPPLNPWRGNADARGKWLVERDYRRIDLRNLLVARLPEGMTGIQALRSAFNGDRDAEWIDELGDERAGNHFRRIYAFYTGAPLVIDLDIETANAFKAAGGKDAF